MQTMVVDDVSYVIGDLRELHLGSAAGAGSVDSAIAAKPLMEHSGEEAAAAAFPGKAAPVGARRKRLQQVQREIDAALARGAPGPEGKKRLGGLLEEEEALLKELG